MPAIEIKNLSKFYGRLPAVIEASMTVEEGEFFGFVGPNGSGKTTTMRVLMNYIKPTSGRAKIFGLDSVRDSVKIKRLVGYVPSELDYCENMRAGDLIDYAASLRRCKNEQKIGELCELFELDCDRRLGRMSLGNRKKVALVTALFHSPRVLLLDEATAGLDPLVKKRFKDLLVEENKKGVTILFCSHDMAEVQELCGRTAIIRAGSILEISDVTALSASDTHRIGVKAGADISGLLAFFHITDAVQIGDYLSFSYAGDMDVFVKALANYPVEDLKVGPPSLEDAILRFYEKKMEREGDMQ